MRKEELTTATYTNILNFWYKAENQSKWFAKDQEFDREITEKFLSSYEEAAKGNLDYWQESLAGSLALIILLDQFPRNMFREHPKSLATDTKALSIIKAIITKGIDKDAPTDYKNFLYMPLMHSENLADQELAAKLFAYDPDNHKYAKMHMEIIKKFGRFPHRNIILGRKSTAEEIDFLKTPNSSF